MSNFKEVLPNVERYAIVVSVPMKSKIIDINAKDIHELKEIFIKDGETTKDIHRKKECEIIVELLKIATSYSAQVYEMYKTRKKLVITLSFMSLEKLVEFNKTMSKYTEN